MTDMELAIGHLEKMLAHRNPGFICAGVGARGAERCLVRVRHSAAGAASEDDLAWLEGVLGAQGQPFFELYGAHDGVVLYVPVKEVGWGDGDCRGGFEIFSIGAMRAMSGTLAAEAGNTGSRGRELLAFARAGNSAGLICIRKPGARPVELVEWNQGARRSGFGVSPAVEELLPGVIYDGPEFLHAMGGAGYSGGRTDTQWVPIRYVADAGAVAALEVASEALPHWFPSREANDELNSNDEWVE
jgi:hypothetical protein